MMDLTVPCIKREGTESEEKDIRTELDLLFAWSQMIPSVVYEK
jgi:hypothetical protein